MIYNMYELIWLFLIYSFLGWMLETILAATEQRRFVNRGLINGPLCTIYGVAIVILTIFGQELPLFWLFLGAMIVATVTEWIGGHMIERFYHERWWDYSDVKWNLDGYICLPASLVWGVLGTVSMRWGNGLLIRLYGFLPEGIGHLLVWILAGMLVLILILFILAIVTLCKLKKLYRKLDRYMRGKDAESLELAAARRSGRRLTHGLPALVCGLVSGCTDMWIEEFIEHIQRLCRLRSRSGIRPYLQQAAACRNWCGCFLSGVCLAILQRRSSAGSLRACG